jgi:NodT family efflux transporter outer membrane factor (OMF) lipoprotein
MRKMRNRKNMVGFAAFCRAILKGWPSLSLGSRRTPCDGDQTKRFRSPPSHGVRRLPMGLTAGADRRNYCRPQVQRPPWAGLPSKPTLKGLNPIRCAFILPLLLTACSVGPDYVTPTAPAPSAAKYKELGDWKPAQPQDGAIRGKWWEIYHDPQLNALEEKVNISNQNVLQAEAQFREAAAVVKVARTSFYPTVTANPSYNLSQASQSTSSGGGSRGSVISSGSGTGTGVVAGGSSQHVGATTVSLYDLPLEASYMVDIWGSVRRTVESDSATAQASFANLENMRLSFQATLAQDYFSLHGLDAQEQILKTNVDEFQKFLDLTTNQYKSGIVSQASVAAAKTQLDTTKAQLINVGVQRAAFEHAIATLVGKPATDFALNKVPLSVIPPPIPPGVPSTLLERRPDIAQAERQVAAANASIGVQVAGYYPQLTLNGSAGVESVKLSDLLTGPSFLWSVGGDLAQTVFDAGATHGRVQEAQANYDATVANYRQVVLTAFQQVEDDLAGLRILKDEAAVQDDAVAAAQQSVEINLNEYKAGTVDYLNVITAEATALSDELTAVTIRTNRMTTSVLLIEALGGGWDAAKLPSAHSVSNPPEAQKQIDLVKPQPAAAH